MLLAAWHLSTTQQSHACLACRSRASRTGRCSSSRTQCTLSVPLPSPCPQWRPATSASKSSSCAAGRWRTSSGGKSCRSSSGRLGLRIDRQRGCNAASWYTGQTQLGQEQREGAGHRHKASTPSRCHQPRPRCASQHMLVPAMPICEMGHHCLLGPVEGRLLTCSSALFCPRAGPVCAVGGRDATATAQHGGQRDGLAAQMPRQQDRPQCSPTCSCSC